MCDPHIGWMALDSLAKQNNAVRLHDDSIMRATAEGIVIQ
jgi:hypothetical protein